MLDFLETMIAHFVVQRIIRNLNIVFSYAMAQYSANFKVIRDYYLENSRVPYIGGNYDLHFLFRLYIIIAKFSKLASFKTLLPS